MQNIQFEKMLKKKKKIQEGFEVEIVEEISRNIETYK